MDSISLHPNFVKLLEGIEAKWPQSLQVEGIGNQLDFVKFRRDFFNADNTADISVDANANVDLKDVVSFGFEVKKPTFRLANLHELWLKIRELHSEFVADELITSHIIGEIYINDLSGDIALPYCFNYSTYDIVLEGLPMVKKIRSVPPKHMLAFFKQLEQFIGIASNNTHGATGIADMLISLSWYVSKDLQDVRDGVSDYKDEAAVWRNVDEHIRSFIYTINQPLFRANQSPFTNISIYDTPFLTKLTEDYIFPDGSKPDIGIIKTLQLMLVDAKNDEMDRTPVTFPIISACFVADEDAEGKRVIKDIDFLNELAPRVVKYAAVELYCGDSATLSSCCRLRSGMIKDYSNSFGGGSTKIGSMGVVTINLPNIAINVKKETSYDSIAQACEEERFLSDLRDTVIKAGLVNDSKRKIIKGLIEAERLPMYNHGFMDLKKQYSTVGLTGVNEALEILGLDILTEEGQEFVDSILEVINSTNDALAIAYEAPHNCEQVPAENSAVKLAQKDHLFSVDKAEWYELYSNQFVPLIKGASMFDRIKLQGRFDKELSGGAICHINVGNKLTVEQFKNLMHEVVEAGVVYWAPVYTYNFCENGHASLGKDVEVCPVCGSKVEKYTKVVGFLTNTKNWNPTRRKHDYPSRQVY